MHALESSAVFVVLLAAGALAARAIGQVVATFAQTTLAAEAAAALRLDVVDAILGGKPLRAPRHGDQGGAAQPRPSEAAATAALTTLARDVEDGVGRGGVAMVRSAAQLLLLGAVAVRLSPGLAAVSLAVWALFGLALSRARRALKRSLSRAAEENEALHGAAGEVARHADLWRVYGASSRVRAHVARLGARLAGRGARVDAAASALSGANEVLGALALAGMVGLASTGVLGLRVADVLPFMAVFFLAYKPVREWNDARLAWARGAAALARVRATALGGATATAPAAVAEGASPRFALADLEVRGLAAAPGLTRPVSFEAPAGSIVCVVGDNGAGKTTLLRALLGLEPASAGAIVYDGKYLQNAPVGPGGRPFAWAPQDAPVVADTVAENVALGGGGADPARALEDVGARGLDPSERVGAAGRALSGGERLWVALARALASGLPVLLLDEPTSALDGAATERALSAIAALRGRRTVVLVTHDPAVRRIADRVVDLGPASPKERAA